MQLSAVVVLYTSCVQGGSKAQCQCVRDALGLEVTVANSASGMEALELFNTAVDLFSNFSRPPMGTLKKALSADPNFFMANFLEVSVVSQHKHCSGDLCFVSQ